MRSLMSTRDGARVRGSRCIAPAEYLSNATGRRNTLPGAAQKGRFVPLLNKAPGITYPTNAHFQDYDYF
jgi:hypothetical protein